MRDGFRLLKYSFRLWPLMLLLILLSNLGSLLSIINPWPMKMLVDNVLGSQALSPAAARLIEHLFGTGKLALLAAVLTLFVVTRAGSGALGVVQKYYNTVFGQRLIADLRGVTFQHLQYLSLSAHEDRRIGDSIYRVMTDTNSAHTMFKDVALPLLDASVTLIGMFLVAWRLDRELTLIALIVLPLMVATSGFFNERIRRLSKISYERRSDLFARIQQTFSNIRIVKAFAREGFEQSAFENINAETLQTNLRLKISESLFSFATVCISTAGTGLVLWISASHALEGTLSVGSILIFMSYLGNLYGKITKIVWLFGSTYQKTVTSGRRLFEILDLPLGVKDPPHPLPLPRVRGEVTFEDVTFGYDPSKPVLRNISFHINPGQTIAVTGATGAGKTTLISLILRFYDPNQGHILLDGSDVRQHRQQDVRSQISLVMQESLFFDTTVRENIRYGKLDATEQEIREAARLADALEFIEQMPDGFDTRVAEGAVRLSGGQKQRLSIARAFLKDSPILILDEPTSALDSGSEERILGALRRLTRNRTTFIIAHRLSTAMEADTVLVLEDGQLVESGSHEDLLRSKGIYYRLFERQINSSDLTYEPQTSDAYETMQGR